MKKFLVICLLLTSSPLLAEAVRSELSRYILLRDRIIIDQDLRRKRYENILDVDLHVSSGTKKVIGDIKNTTEGSDSSANKSASILEVINKNINSERFASIDAVLGFPLPYLKIKNFQFLPNFFYENHVGISMSFTNDESVTDPVAQVFVKKHSKLGVFSQLKWKDNQQDEVQLAVYRYKKADLFYKRTSTEIVSSEGVFDLDELTDEEISYSFDMGYKNTNEKRSYIFEAREIAAMISSKGKDSKIGNIPLLHAGMQRFYTSGIFKWTPFFGLHFRKRYNVVDGMYLGTKVKHMGHLPFEFIFKLTNQFFNFSGKYEIGFIYFNYALKQPYRNPQDGLWVPGIHSVSLGIPF